eukprot:1997504-Prorocentrum_lima.AAC.1
MTSSLVGSEMCIRDRSKTVAQTPRYFGERDAWVAGLRSERIEGVWDPVSYTHLTLPTICSV